MTVSELVAAPSRVSSWMRDTVALMLLWMAVGSVYWSPRPSGGTQLASDYYGLHVHRMSFAREALFGSAHSLPDWYPRELLGTPFWANIQNFPFIPTRLFLLLFDPWGRYTYTIGITLAAVLGATFTYLYAKRIGIGRVGSAAAGWTFVACGYFAARMAAGHLPLLEVYGALPLLLWCIESLVQAREEGRPIGRWVAGLGFSAMCVMLAGHPQLPVYAMAAAGVYAIWRAGMKGSVLPLGSMALGTGCAAFALVPMAMLVGRSTRVLPLAAARNDLALPYGRVLGFFFPWWDGAAAPLARAAEHPFAYPTPAYFWDTFCYAGWIPWIGVGFLLMTYLPRRMYFTRLLGTPADGWKGRQWSVAIFVGFLGIAGVVLALPIARQISAMIPGTFLRSPARLLYLTEFALALGLGVTIHVLLSSRLKWAPYLVAIVLVVHAIDLRSTSREFDVRGPGMDSSAVDQAITPLLRDLGDARIGVDVDLDIHAKRRFDDVGFFDSVMLARPYQLLLDLTGAPKDLNEQQINASHLSPRALEATGVKFVFTRRERPNLRLIGSLDETNVYATNIFFRRAAFFSSAQVPFVDDDQLRDFIRDPQTDLTQWLPLPRSAMPASKPNSISDEPATVQYSRINSDRIECTVTNGQFGYLRLIESWDPGWSATVNGNPTPIVPAMGALLAVALPPGTHQVSFTYRTPGATLGLALSCLSAFGLAALTWTSRKLISPDAFAESARLAEG